jgi:hypothetical protein
MKEANVDVEDKQSLLKVKSRSLKFSGSIVQLVNNNLSLISNRPVANKPAPRVNWCNLSMLMVMYSCINNCYWMTLYNVTNLEGDKFLNGLILGLAECFAGIFAGVVITLTSPTIAFQTCCVMAILFNALNQFFFAAGTFMGYTTLFIAILGVGGVYTCLFVLIGCVIPK